MFNVSQATGIEVRAKFNNYSRHGDYGHHKGASCWSPVVNIMRDPRWGRNQVRLASGHSTVSEIKTINFKTEWQTC